MLTRLRVVGLLAALGVVLAAVSVGASLDSRVRLRCPGGATPQRLEFLAILGVAHGLVPARVTITESSLVVGFGESFQLTTDPVSWPEASTTQAPWVSFREVDGVKKTGREPMTYALDPAGRWALLSRLESPPMPPGGPDGDWTGGVFVELTCGGPTLVPHQDEWKGAGRHASLDALVRAPSRGAALEFVGHHLEHLDPRRQRGLALILELLRVAEAGEAWND